MIKLGAAQMWLLEKEASSRLGGISISKLRKRIEPVVRRLGDKLLRKAFKNALESVEKGESQLKRFKRWS